MMWIIRIALWPLMIALSLVLSIIGIPVVGYLAWGRDWTLAPGANGRAVFRWAPPWAWLWSNLEDGVIPPAMVNGQPYLMGRSDRWRSFVWCAWRNKVSNLRFTRGFGFTVKPARVYSIGNNRNLYEPLPAGGGWFWSLAWQGPYAGLWLLWRGAVQLRIGWALVPADADGFDTQDLRQLWCGFTFQLNRGA